MIHLTRRERFNAAHRLFKIDWDDKKNFEYFGKCANPNWHGHNYELFVTVKGDVNTQLGFVVNLKRLSEIIKEKVIDKLDHKNLNLLHLYLFQLVKDMLQKLLLNLLPESTL